MRYLWTFEEVLRSVGFLELLEAAEGVSDALTGLMGRNQALRDAMDTLRAAIAKAKGDE